MRPRMAPSSPGPVDPRLLEYDYLLPEDRIATYPAADRADARLLVVGAERADRQVRDLPSLLAPGDLLVVNDSAVIRARLRTRRVSGGAAEILLLGAGPGPVEAMVRPARRLRPGERFEFGELTPGVPGAVTLIAPREDGTWLVEATPSPLALMEARGEVPLPPYLGRAEEQADRERYQTVYAGPPGAVAAPTAGLHFTPELLAALASRGVELARVTLHVGPGTFRNLRSEDLDRGRLHAESYEVSPAAADAVARTRARGGRVVAVGTTSTRALESAAASDGVVRAGLGRTDLFIRPGYTFRAVDRLLTNFHLPRSSLLMLVAAFGGRARVLDAYAHAVGAGYRFYSYGDAMLLDPAP